MPVYAPYNFVPLSKKIFFPDWADQVSHDIPFSDGISGTIQCRLTTESPVYIRNGGNWNREDIVNKDPSKENSDAHSFFRVGSDFIIPGTSLKGMLRNVIEIASFGKMKRVQNRKYSFRDLSKGHPYLKLMRGAKTGWLTLDKATRAWFLAPCEFARIDHNELIKHDPQARDIKLEQIALSKYKTWTKSLDVKFDLGEKTPSGVKALNLGSNTAATTGTIVFTGQPSANDGKKGKKHLEFIFHSTGTVRTAVNPNLIREVEFIHAESEDWKFHKERGVIPVFYHGSSNSPQSIGLALMYRLPYDNTIHDAIRHVDKETGEDHFHEDPDLAETLFGFESDPEGLKGRVFISPAIADLGKATPGNTFHTILSGPKPTYYPSYLEQKNSPKSLTTLQDSSAVIRGWKRYPARPFQDGSQVKPAENQLSVSTKFIPLNTGAEFNFAIRVHNLRPAELGALLWALEWGGNKDLCHSLGMGKSIGLGQVKITINQNTSNLLSVLGEPIQLEGLHKEFEKLMVEQVTAEWEKTNQMVQLLGMAQVANAAGKTLKHMTLEPTNQFSKEKNNLSCLATHVANAPITDSELFKNLKPRPVRSKADKEAKKKIKPAPDPLTAALLQLEKISDWGGFKQHVLSSEILGADKSLEKVSKPVYELALQIRTKWKSSWEVGRDTVVAEWLAPAGLPWPPAEPAATGANESGVELERIKAIARWADYLAAPADMGILSKNGLKQLREKLKGWGCDAKDAKEDKKALWNEVNQRMKV
ncbi:MAG TPA: TIGR03986 family CRISPR-associated RAMP protein [Desulfuromonadales bacterium]|nr:TIGR03986 family CRISPR-associated RAMP protein [Desulfuromonadales bacterium]